MAIPGAALAAADDSGRPAAAAAAPDGAPAYDVRARQRPTPRPAARRRAQLRLRRLLGRGAVVAVDPLTATPSFVGSSRGFLTRRSRERPSQVALGFVRRNAAAFGLDAGDLRGLRVAQSYRTRRGLRVIRWQQTYRGIPAFDDQLRAALQDNRLVSLAGPVQPDLAVPSTTPRLSAAEAMRRALAGVGVRRAVRQRGPARGPDRRTRLSSGFAELTLFSEGSRTRLAWKLFAFADSDHVYLTVIDARDGSLLRRANLVQSASGQAHRYFPGSNSAGSVRASRNFTTTGADPWLMSGSTLNGDNTHVYSDEDDNLGYDCCGLVDLPEPSGGDEIPPSSPGAWNFVQDTTIGSSDSDRRCPAAGCTWNGFNTTGNWNINREQAGTQLFFFVNNFHDYLQADPGIGFNDASGNFEQASTGGTGGDPVIAQVDDGAETRSGGGFPDCDHVNNANMLTLPESFPAYARGPKMQMYLWTAFCGDSTVRDTNGADDAAIVYHEYTHGLSNRLVDPETTTGLLTAQGGAMGEAWSDWYAMDYLVGQGLDTDTNALNEILIGKYEVPGGLRTKGLDVPVASGGYTLGDFGNICPCGQEVHADGEIWGETLWDLRRSLVGHYGLSTGERHVRTLVTDAMRIGPSAPTFLDMRNAILFADAANKLGDCARIWAVFAARGMGEGAEFGQSDTIPFEQFFNPSSSRCPRPPVKRSPAPTAPGKASFTKSKRTIRVSGSGRFSFSFTAAAGLTGRITLKTVRKVRPRKRGRKSRATFANKTFTVPTSGKVKVKFKLSRRNRLILKRYKKLRISVTVRLRNSADLASTAKVRITLKAPKPKRKRRH